MYGGIIMVSFYRSLIFVIPTQYKQEFYRQKFMDNNMRILILAVFLTVEQMYYGFFVRVPGSLIQKIHLLTALLMFIYVVLSTYFQIKKPFSVSRRHQIYEVSFGFWGLFIATSRAILIHTDVFRIPTIFIAVLYGLAVIYYLSPIQSLSIYCIMSSLLILFLPIFQSDIVLSNYIEDTISNAIIAWIASLINYRKYVKEFINKKIIQRNNEELKEKNVKIQKMNEKLVELSIKDGLTNIYNRRKLDEVLKYEYRIAQKQNIDFSVILLDLDNFKCINDTFGHNVGDQVLIEIAHILKSNIRKRDTVGRWGGEEFLIICPETNLNQALELAEQLRKTIESHHFLVIDYITGSFGVSTYRGEDTIDTLINRVDKGLYRAKGNERNKVEFIIN